MELKFIYFIVAFLTISGTLKCQNLRQFRPQKGPIYSRGIPGCLDAGWSIGDTYSLIYPHFVGPCPSLPHNQWTFTMDGSLQTIHHGRRKCLDCARSQPNCHLLAHDCNGKANQKFKLEIQPTQLDFSRSQVDFTISSALFPGRCLTSYYGTQNITFPERYSNNWHIQNRRKIGTNAYIGEHYAFRLEECTGNSRQSFYLKNALFVGEPDSEHIPDE